VSTFEPDAAHGDKLPVVLAGTAGLSRRLIALDSGAGWFAMFAGTVSFTSQVPAVTLGCADAACPRHAAS